MQKLWVKVFIFYSFIEVYASFVEIIRKKKLKISVIVKLKTLNESEFKDLDNDAFIKDLKTLLSKSFNDFPGTKRVSHCNPWETHIF